MKAIDLS